ncbi:urease accessory protein UreD [Oceanobacillus chungangensis]|uniref:urease accessory protein UreD n=1 Tax=Oceanobacillus chungangensis TaxID=1229152 RepID=UPI0024828C84|nr:urease accessory protein UreD [Oceanobacillus chungangensis]
MEGYSHLGSMILVGEKVKTDLLNRLYQVIDSSTKEYKVGLSSLPIPGLTIRVLANNTQTIEKMFSEFHHIISKECFNKTPSLRKY